MSIAGYFGNGRNDIRADRKDTAPQKETEKRYRTTDEYDPVLRSHCGLNLNKPSSTEPGNNGSWDYWLSAVDKFYKKSC